MEHPLFPGDDSREAPEVEWIHVVRDSPTGPVWCHRRFAPHELTGLEQIAEAFGGGSYELIAYARGRISGRRRYRLEGARRPMNGEDGAEYEPAPAPSQLPPSGGGGDNQVLLTVLQLVMQQSAQSQQATLQMMTALATASQNQAREHLERMQALHSANAQQQTSLLTAVLGRASGTSVEDMARLIELGRNMGSSGDDDDSPVDELADAVSTIAQGMKLAQGEPSGEEEAAE